MLAFKAFISLALSLLAVANPLVVRNDPPTICNSGELSCCKSVKNVTDSSSTGTGGLLGGLGLPSLLGGDLLGSGCSPIEVIDVGSGSCSQQTVCCTGNNFNGVTLLGCSPINLNL